MTSYVNPSGTYVWRDHATVAAPRPVTRRPGVLVTGTFRRRLAASIVDSLVVAMLSCATSIAVILPLMHAELERIPVNATSLESAWWQMTAVHQVVAVLLALSTIIIPAWLYFVAQECSTWSATLGKRLMNLKVTDLRGNRLSFGCATARFVLKTLTVAIAPFIVLSMVAVVLSKGRRSLHDLLANSIVTPSDLARR